MLIENLFECLHLLAISERLLSKPGSLDKMITSFSVEHKSHFFDEGRYGEHCFSIDHAISNCLFSFCSCQMYCESLVSSLCLMDLNEDLWLLNLSLKVPLHAPKYTFFSWGVVLLVFGLVDNARREAVSLQWA